MSRADRDLERRLLVCLDGTGPRSRAYLVRAYGSQIEPIVDGLLERGVLVRRGSKRCSVVAIKGRRAPRRSAA